MSINKISNRIDYYNYIMKTLIREHKIYKLQKEITTNKRIKIEADDIIQLLQALPKLY